MTAVSKTKNSRTADVPAIGTHLNEVPITTKNSGAFAPVGSLFAGFQLEDAGGYITQEFQDYGYRLALTLDDLRHKSLYIKMAKEVPRGQLESALSYVSDASAVKSKAKLFMWRLRQLQQPRAQTDPSVTIEMVSEVKSSAATHPVKPSVKHQ